MHILCGIEYDIIYQDKEMHKDILNIITPKKIDEEGNTIGERTISNPTKICVQLEIYHNCLYQI